MLSRTSSISGTGRTIAPNQLPNLKAWYRADALNLSNGASVTSWTDSSGVGNSLTTSVGTQTFTAADAQFNNKPTVTFDKSGYLARIGGVSITGGSAAATIYFVGIVNDDKPSNTSYAMASWGANGTENRIQVACRPFIDTYFMEFSNTNAAQFVASVGVPVIVTYSLPAGATVGSKPIYVNGAEGPLASVVGGDGILNIIPDEIVIGASTGDRGNTGIYLSGKVAEVIIYNAEHNLATRRSIEKYFSQKYGIVTV